MRLPNMTIDHTLHIHTPWAHEEVYDRAMEWVGKYYDSYPPNTHPHYGISYINGKVYVHTVVFMCEEDKLAFRLTFPELF